MRRRNERGVVAVEFALILPLLVLFLIGSLQVGLVVVGNSTASNAAREGVRAASIRYECADNHISARCTANPSTNYTFIRNAVMDKLAGLVQEDSVTVSVECRANSATGTLVLCERGYVDPDTDVVVVNVGWRHIGATPYLADAMHTTTAHAVALGRPDLITLSPEPDTTPATLLTANVYDTNTNGVLDQIQLTFSEDIEQTVNASLFTIANSPTGSNTISAATVANRVVTLTMSGGSTVNTAPGAMTVSLAAGSNGIRDLWGNQSSFTGQTLTDRARPILTNLTDTNLLVNGQPSILESMTMTFSEPIATVLATTTISYTDPSGGGNDTISMSGITAGPLTTNSNSYNTSNDSTTTFPGVVSMLGNTVTVSLLNPLVCSPALCLNLGIVLSETAWTFTPATTLVDANNNTATGSRTISSLF